MNLKYVNGNIMKSNSKNHFDEYFTKPEISEHLYKKTCEIISKYEKLDKYTWIEPSVGDGSFYNLLPKNKIGIDIKETKYNTVLCDYLNYDLPEKPLIVIGNPPFGHRGVLALKFIEHSESAEFVAFILPMFFQSLGKGSIRYRVKNFNLLYEEVLPENSFYTSKGELNSIKEKDIKCCFQIWSKNHKDKFRSKEFCWYNQTSNAKKLEPFHNLLKVVTVSLAKNRECGKEWIFNKKANHYLSSTFFKNIYVVDDFNLVKYKSGIAIIYTTQNDRTIKKLDAVFKTADWNKYSSVATNGCRHIGKSHIYKLLEDKGFKQRMWNKSSLQ